MESCHWCRPLPAMEIKADVRLRPGSDQVTYLWGCEVGKDTKTDSLVRGGFPDHRGVVYDIDHV